MTTNKPASYFESVTASPSTLSGCSAASASQF